MKGKEFQDIFNLSKDTLRFYRDSGLVNPVQLSNGYFEYSSKDIASLLYAFVRAKRYDEPIASISEHLVTDNSKDFSDIENDELQRKLKDLTIQIEKLERKKDKLISRINYRKGLINSIDKINEATYVPGLSFVSVNDKANFNDIHRMISTEEFFNGLAFPVRDLNNEYIYPEYIIGITDPNNPEHAFTFENERYIHSARKAIRYTIEIDNLEKISTRKFERLLRYVNSNHYRLYPYVTSIILDVHINPEKYIVMFRFLIED